VNPCLLIPIYEHGSTIGAVVDSLAGFDLPCLIVDDGSGEATRAALARVAAEHPWVSVKRHDVNRGRGAALRTGYRWAASRGFTHALQLDADGQHESRDVPRLLEAAHKDPRALVLGRPLFDASAPKARLYGRKLSQGLVWLETLSFAIEDPLCGLRCLPLEPVLRLLDENAMGDRMDFDPELAVRLYWMGLPIANVPTRVRYPEGGLSHFAQGYDSWLIARAHVRLVGGMLRRIPDLTLRRRAASGA
jgi:glycosyltransferase involved in cell wall biosynthesis